MGMRDRHYATPLPELVVAVAETCRNVLTWAVVAGAAGIVLAREGGDLGRGAAQAAASAIQC